MFSATLSINDPFSLQKIQHPWVWNHLHLCFPGLQNGECSSLHICSLASRNIFPLLLKIQMFKGMFAFHSKVWLMVLQMQGGISSNVSYWYSIGFLLRPLCPWCHCEHSLAGRASKAAADWPGIPAGFTACPEFLLPAALAWSQVSSSYDLLTALEAGYPRQSVWQQHWPSLTSFATCCWFLWYPTPALVPAPVFMQLHLERDLGTQLL